MDSPVQEDPYVALGLGREASASEIKSAYRKLALRCHPDKVTDESLKKKKADEFHQIQQAYEILSNEESRSRYDARLRLAELKAEMMRREGGRAAAPSTFDARPPAQSFASFRGGHYEVRMPKFADSTTPDTRSTPRKAGDAGAFKSRTSPQTVKVEEKRRSDKEDKARSERRRARDADIRDSRDRKYHSSSETVNDRSHFEEERKKRDDVVKQREEAMRKAEERRRHEAHAEEAERRRSKEARESKAAYDNVDTARPTFSIPDYLKESVDKARRYQESANYSTSRPQPVRAASKDYHDADVRRSRAKPAENRRRSPEVVEPPTLNKAATTGHRDILREMAGEGNARMPERSYSNNVGADTHDRTTPPPGLNRHSTMPNVHSSRDSLKRDARSSKLRPEVKIPDSGYSSPNTPTPDQTYPTVPTVSAPPMPKVSTYRYTPAGAVAADYMSASPDTYAAPYVNLETRVPKTDKDRAERRRGREASTDLPRPPMGAGARSYSREDVPRRPSYVRADTERPRVDPERERDRDRGDRRRERDSERRREREMYYGEVTSDFTKKNGIRAKDYREEVRKGTEAYMRSGRDRGYDEKDRDYVRPSLSRSNTINVW